MKHHEEYGWSYPVICKDNVPALFFVCHESRTEVVSRYTQLSGTVGPAVYYNSNMDILVFRYAHSDMVFEFENWPKRIPTDFVASIKHMAWECEERMRMVPQQRRDYNFYPDNYFTVANLNEPSSLKTLQVCQYADRSQRMTIGFREDEDKTQDKTFRDFVVDQLKHSGHDWAEEFEDIRPDWVAPQIKFGDFILDEAFDGTTQEI
jgi:tellurite resistance-related uncharacterized protein